MNLEKLSSAPTVKEGGFKEGGETKLNPEVASKRFDLKEGGNKQKQIDALNQTMDDLANRYETLRGKKDPSAAAAKNFIVSQSELLIQQLEKLGVVSSGIVTDEMLESSTMDQSKITETQAIGNVPANIQQPVQAEVPSPVFPPVKKNLLSRFSSLFARKSTPTQVASNGNAKNIQPSGGEIGQTSLSHKVETLNAPIIPQDRIKLPFKTPINTEVINDELFAKRLLYPNDITKKDMPISGQQAYERALPAIKEMMRLQKLRGGSEEEKSGFSSRDITTALAQLQGYVGLLSQDNQTFIERAKNDALKGS